MRNAILFGLISALLISSVAKTVVFADYLLNYDYISKVLCINKDKPEMHCNGKCHLAKELKKQDTEESKPFAKTGISVPEIAGVLTAQLNLPLGAETANELLFPSVSEELNTVYTGFFHPPDC